MIGAVGLILAALGITATVIAGKIRRGRWKYKEREHDAFLRTYNQAFRAFPVVALVLAFNSCVLLHTFWKHPDDKQRIYLTAFGTLAAFAGIWTYALKLSPRFRTKEMQRLIKDEFFQDNLSKSRSDGFYALLATLTACFFTGLFSERLAISLLPLAAGFSVAFAGWRFNRRDAKALGGE